MAKITTSEIDSLIRKTIKDKGLSSDISEQQLNDIKNKIIEKANSDLGKKNKGIAETIEDEIVNIPTQNTNPEVITQTTTINQDEIEQAKENGELNQKEEELNKKEIDLANRESELQRKEDQLAYKPILPETLQDKEKEEFFIYNSSELSYGAEALSFNQFRNKNSPDSKSSMNDIWAREGKTLSDVYIVEFKKVGELKFNPFNGTTTFTEQKFEVPEKLSQVPQDGMTPEDAVKSQSAIEQMQDTIEPIVNKILPPSEDMGLKNAINVENMVKERIDKMIKDYFLQIYPKI